MTVDQAIGQRVRTRRVELELSADDLAALVGITPSELHAHESGDSRISAAVMFALCAVLEVPLSYFFDSL